jgi:hypothetical protein
MIDESSIRKEFIRIFKKKRKQLKKETLDQLVSERLENMKFIQENGDDPSELPDSEEIKTWFIDPPDHKEILLNMGSPDQKNVEFDYDSVCLKDSLAEKIFERFYGWYWKQGDQIPPEIEKMILLNRIVNTDKDMRRVSLAKTRLANLSMVGVVRFYKMERRPYFSSNEIIQADITIRKILTALDDITNGKYSDSDITGEIYIFDVFKKGKQ